jgi:hypothetical protein
MNMRNKFAWGFAEAVRLGFLGGPQTKEKYVLLWLRFIGEYAITLSVENGERV